MLWVRNTHFHGDATPRSRAASNGRQTIGLCAHPMLQQYSTSPSVTRMICKLWSLSSSVHLLAAQKLRPQHILLRSHIHIHLCTSDASLHEAMTWAPDIQPSATCSDYFQSKWSPGYHLHADQASCYCFKWRHKPTWLSAVKMLHCHVLAVPCAKQVASEQSRRHRPPHIT